jgi:N-acetylglucosaminyldiphosphoundecaprenol N-acetyl-beta-D-mannosaminyltransferase
MRARKDAAFQNILNAGDMVVPDGVGVVLASRLWPVRFKERVPGYDLLLAIFDRIKGTGRTVYFYGGAPGVAELAKAKMEAAYPGLNVAGARNGFIDEAEQEEMIAEICRLKPDILVVCTGFPRQEFWIDKNKNRLPCKLLIGAGGSLDGFSGTVKRAPVFFRKLGLEWLYRLMRQPSRFKRQLQLPLFMVMAVAERIKHKR